MTQPHELLEFIRLVLPEEGWLCAFVLETKQTAWFRTDEELVEFILFQDAAGYSVYHCNASFKEPTRRKIDNALWKRSLYSDVDCGGKGQYADRAMAISYTAGFVETLALPMPQLIASGGGLHLYWPLSQDISNSDWLDLAIALKNKMVQYDFRADHRCTIDPVRILRPPGTCNRKRGVVPVLRGPLVEAIPLDRIRHALIPHPSNFRPDITAKAKTVYTGPDILADAETIADDCAHMRTMRDTRGILSEPLWRNCLSNLSRCDRGREFAHTWSDGHEHYSPADVDARFDRFLELTGPIGCAEFETDDTTGACRQCPHRGTITNPCQLGRQRDPIPRAADPAVVSKLVERDLPALKEPFSWGPNAELMMGAGDSRNRTEVKVLSTPFLIMGQAAGERHDQHYMLSCEYYMGPHDGWKALTIPAETFHGQGASGELQKRGVNVHHIDGFRKYIRDTMDTLRNNQPASVLYESMGWKNNNTEFLFGDMLYTATGPRRVPVSTGIADKLRLGFGPRKGGDADRWKAAADNLFGVGCETQSLGVLAGFGSILISLLDPTEGGAIVENRYPGSGGGKSVALLGSTSMWGFIDSVKLTNIDTAVSKPINLSIMGNLPVMYDEFSDKDPEKVKEFIQVFTEGRDKTRGTQAGDLAPLASSWCMILFCSTNKSLIDATEFVDGYEAPLTWRVMSFDLEQLPEHRSAYGDRLKNQLGENCGHAGHRFLSWLLHPPHLAWTIEKLRSEYQRIMALGFHEHHRYWVRTLACASVAGQIVEHIGLVSVTPKRIIDWALGELLPRVTPRDQVLARRQSEAARLFNGFVDAHLNCMLTMDDEAKQGRQSVIHIANPPNQLYIRKEKLTRRIMVNRSVFGEWLRKRNVSLRDWIKNGYARGFLIEEKQKVLGAGTTLATGTVFVLVIDDTHSDISGEQRPDLKLVHDARLLPESSSSAPRTSAERSPAAAGSAPPPRSPAAE